MKRTKRTEVTVQTRRILSAHTGSILAWCGVCSAQVPMIRAEEAAARAHVSLEAICRLMKAPNLHHAGTSDDPFVCLPCLERLAQGNQ